MKETIKDIVNTALAEISIEPTEFVVEHPADLSHGDYAVNVAMVLAKKIGKNPRALAEEIVFVLEKNNHSFIESVSVAGPGFINFHLDKSFFAEKLNEVLTKESEWGSNESLDGKKYFVEYTDPNPFKEFHIGHLFTNSVGEAISRLVQFSGADTKRLCYQGDVGMHVANAIYGMIKLGYTATNDLTAKDLGKAYACGATVYKDGSQTEKEEIKVINKKIYDRTDPEINELYDLGRKVSLEYFETIYKKLDTHFDEYFFESEAGPKGVDLIKSHEDIFSKSDGAVVFAGDKYGLHTRVFLNSEGLPTYEVKELALSKMKEDRLGDFDHSIISTSNEINDYFKVLKKAMSFIYPEIAAKTEHIGHGTVRLASGKMSSRTGDVIAATDFIDDIALVAAKRIAESNPKLAGDKALAEVIALGAIKFSTLKGNILQDSIFDKEAALSFEGATGPYLQYTHARINSVLEKAEAAGVVAKTEITSDKVYDVEKLIYRFEEVVLEAMEERLPHKVAQYLIELAGTFNTFYAEEKIADKADEAAPYKAAVTKAVGQTIKNGLWLLGIKAPAEM